MSCDRPTYKTRTEAISVHGESNYRYSRCDECGKWHHEWAEHCRLRVGLAGVGRWGRNYVGLVDPVAILRRSSSSFAERETTTDADEFLRAADLVIVATPVETHADLVCRALEAGKRVLCEKPLCSTWDDFMRIHNAAYAARPGSLLVGYQHLWHPEFESLRRAARHDVSKVGAPLRYVDVQWGGNRSDMLDWAPHAFSMACALPETREMRIQTGRCQQHCIVQGINHLPYVGGPCNPPPLTRMVHHWLHGTPDYRWDLWRRVEPAVLGLCGSAHAREETTTQ